MLKAICGALMSLAILATLASGLKNCRTEAVAIMEDCPSRSMVVLWRSVNGLGDEIQFVHLDDGHDYLLLRQAGLAVNLTHAAGCNKCARLPVLGK